MNQKSLFISLTFQYCAIVRKMNVLGCNDQFFNIFLNVWVFGVSFTMALLNNVVPGKMSLNFYICTGEDPKDYEDIRPKASIFHTFTYNIHLSISMNIDNMSPFPMITL